LYLRPCYPGFSCSSICKRPLNRRNRSLSVRLLNEFFAMSSRLRLLYVFMLSLWWVASAQSSGSAAVLEQFPACAVSTSVCCCLQNIMLKSYQQRCLLTGFAKGTCSPTDMNCICSNQQFQSSVSQCVFGNCTVIEALCMSTPLSISFNLRRADLSYQSNEKH
jgi:hypothetical protein